MKEELSAKEVVELTFEKVVTFLGGKKIEFSRSPCAEIAYNLRCGATKSGFNHYKKVFRVNEFVIALGYVCPSHVTESFTCDISLIPLQTKMCDIFEDLEKSRYYKNALIVALTDGGIFSEKDFFKKLFITKGFNDYVKDFDFRDYQYSPFRRDELKYSKDLPDFLAGRMCGYIIGSKFT